MTETKSAPTNAAVKFVTVNPLITDPRNQKTRPLIMSEKSPRVTIVIGNVKMVIRGRINILKRVKQAPTTSETESGLTVTPVTTCVVAQTATESINQCKIIRIY